MEIPIATFAIKLLVDDVEDVKDTYILLTFIHVENF
jgi:hypothetical protein